jgi:hypothetical protein
MVSMTFLIILVVVVPVVVWILSSPRQTRRLHEFLQARRIIPVSMLNIEHTVGKRKLELELADRPRENISEDLLDHLHWTLSNTPPEERRHARWVMSDDWYGDVLRMTDAQGHSLWDTPRRIKEPETLMGIPVDIRDGEGPPHLEVYEGPAERPPAVPDNGGYIVPQPELDPIPVDRSSFSPARGKITRAEMQGWDELNRHINTIDLRLRAVTRAIGNLENKPAGYRENQLASLQRAEARLRAERKATWDEMQAFTDRMEESLAPAGIVTANARRSREEIKEIRDMTVREYAEYRKAGYWNKTMVLPESAEFIPVPDDYADIKFEKYVPGVGMITCDSPEKLARAVEVVTTYPEHAWLAKKDEPERVTPLKAPSGYEDSEDYRYALIERKIREHDNVCHQDLSPDEKDEKRERIRQELEELTNHPGDAITYAITYPGK